MKGKVILWVVGVIVLLGLVAVGAFYLADNRYRLAYDSYRDVQEAITMDLSFESRIGQDRASVGIRGNTVITTPEPRQSLTGVYLQSNLLNDPRIFDLYTSGDEVYHHYNLPFLPWQKGMPLLQEDGFNPVVFAKPIENVGLWDLFKFSYVLEKQETEFTLDFYTTDYFTNEEFKGILTKSLGIDADQVENYEIRDYEIKFSFARESNEFKAVTLTFTQQVNELILDSYFTLKINELTDELRTIVVPNGVENIK